MKIGILTLPLHTNYGGILQAHALQTVLERMGHNVRVIDYDSMKPLQLPLWKMPFAYSKRIFKNILGHPTKIFWEQYQNQKKTLIRQHTNYYINKYINRHIINHFSEIKEHDYEAFVVGSDQVWRPKYFTSLFNSDISNAYLSFAAHWQVKRLSYAASFGVDTWEYNKEQTEKCKYLINKFNAISVREDSAQILCAENYDVTVEHVLDPTMLLTKEDYESLLNKECEKELEGEIMTYILDDNTDKDSFVKKVETITGYKSFCAKAKSDNRDSINDLIQPPIEHWIQGFRDAKIIITDSFHACVFSILFRKPFFVIMNDGRGKSRFQSLLRMFGLEDRIVSPNSIISQKNIEYPIPDSTYEILDNMRKHSFDFLKIINNE